MLRALTAGERDPEVLAGLTQGRLRTKVAQLREALWGRVTDHHGFMLQELLTHVEFLDHQIARFDARVEAQMRPLVRRSNASTPSPAWPGAVPSKSWPNSGTT